MIFKVTKINKELDMYNVVSDTGEEQVVTAGQILGVILKGYTFTNVGLTSKGFRVATEKGYRYIQVKVNKEVQKMIDAYLINKKTEKVNKQKIDNSRNKKVENTKKKSHTEMYNKVISIGSSEKSKVINYRGKVYLSPEQLCKEFKVDVKEFKDLYSKGYSVSESLGIVPKRDIEQLKKDRARNDRALLEMERNRGK